jgi:DUF4097 and DUF4098 domain-containing protein YvlB
MVHRFLASALVLAVFASVVLSGCSTMERTEEFYETYPAPAGTRVDVDNKSGGDVAITGWNIDYVEVSAVKTTIWGEAELDKVEIQVTSGNTNILIETIVTGKNVRASVDYEIKIPNDSVLSTVRTSNGKAELQGVTGNVTVTASNGGIYVEDLSGRLNATTSNGRIELNGVSGGGELTTSSGGIAVKNSGASVTATTTNGNIEIEDCEGDAVLNASNGGISVRTVNGYVTAKTSNGPIDITGAAGIAIAETSNNRVKAEIASTGPGGTTLKTANGSIEVSVSPALNADVEMKTTSGQISIISAPSSLRIVRADPTYFQGVLGAGGPKIYVETTNSSIDFYKLGAG